MIAFIIRRILNMIPLLFIISIFTFFVIQVPPGDFFDTMQAEIASSGSSQDAATFNILRQRYGLDEPFHVQYMRWVQGWPQGDFGWSMAWSAPVLPLVMDRMLYTILLGGFALIITISYAIPVGIYSANHQYSIGDNFFSLFGFLGLSLPGFLLALFWLFVGALIFHIDVGGTTSAEFSEAPMSLAKLYDMWNHFWPAAIILGLASTAQMQRIMRGSMLDTMNQQFITTARAKGLKERTVVNRYGVRVAINPMISVMALEIPEDHLIICSGRHRTVATDNWTAFSPCATDPGYVSRWDFSPVHGAPTDGFQSSCRHRAGLGRSKDCLRIMSTTFDPQDLYDLYRDLDTQLAKERYAELEEGQIAKNEDENRYSLSQRQLMWRKFVRNRAALIGGIVIVTLYIVALFANFVAPYTLTTRFRDRLYLAPQRVHIFDEGRIAPFVYRATTKLDIQTFEQVTVTDYNQKDYIKFFVHGEPYTLFGFIETDRHLFGAEDSVVNILGTEAQGRYMFTRIVIGSQSH